MPQKKDTDTLRTKYNYKKEESPINSAINEVLNWAVAEGASDIHLIANRPPCIRLHGELLPLSEIDTLGGHWTTVLTNTDIENYATEIIQKGFSSKDELMAHLKAINTKGAIDISHHLPGVSRFRCSIYQQRSMLGIAMRPIPVNIPTIEELNMTSPRIMKGLATRKNGLVLITGPTGSGKSTTLAAMINHINEQKYCNIITLEDPIEYMHTHNKSTISQIEIGADVPSFAVGLRSALRQDPDVILIGEMRDLETISIALTAAETGHLVLATLHTRNTTQTVDRIIDVFPTGQQPQIRTQLAGSLQGIVSQQLIPRTDGDGRALAQEILLANTAVQNNIREGKTHQIASIMQMNRREGMQLMDHSIEGLINKGVVSYSDVAEYLTNTNNKGGV